MEELNLNKHWLSRELEEGLIHFRDSLQFELKSEFSIDLKKKKNVYTQEMYIFIPESLQINEQTYSSQQFYLDETTFIRYKTPTFTFKQILNKNNPLSPLTRIENLKKEDRLPKDQLVHELKMFGNIYRSTLRSSIKILFDDLSKIKNYPLTQEIEEKVTNLLDGIKNTRDKFERLRQEYTSLKDEEINTTFSKIYDFFCMITENYLLGFLDFFRKMSLKDSQILDQKIVEFIKLLNLNQKDLDDEKVLLDASALNKFVYEALSLNSDRVEIQKKHSLIIGMLTAGIAMFVYLGILLWQAGSSGVNTFPFLVLAVVLYVLKDRIKEGLKELYAQNAYRWFPDYSTVIKGPAGRQIGLLNESVLFVDEKEVPKEFSLFKEDFLSETIIQYKRQMILYSNISQSRRNELAAIFRFNIHKFLQKAHDSVQTRLRLIGNKLEEKKLPKVYFLTILLKNTIGTHSEIKKFRVIINKAGIDRVQYFGSYTHSDH